MEGACGKIVPTDIPSRIKKLVYKKPGKQRRTKSLRAPEQFQIQSWAHSECQALNGYMTLRVPAAYNSEAHSYEMDRIDAKEPLRQEEAMTDPTLMEDLRRFFAACRARGLYPLDFELYSQPDGTVAMIDFDKFGQWQADGSVLLPFGMTWTPEQVRSNTWIR